MTKNLKNFGIFRAYDIRGKYPAEINEEIVSEIIHRFFSNKLTKLKAKKFKIVVGHDARLSSPALYRAAIKGIKNKELRIKDKKNKFIIHNSQFIILPVGLITTPMLYFLVNYLNADFGIVITASHNPKEYNGLKIVGSKAAPIGGKEILKELSRKK